MRDGARRRAVDVILVLAIVALWILILQTVKDRSGRNPAKTGTPETAETTLLANANTQGAAQFGPVIEKLGVKVTGANLAVGGTRPNVRYQVADSERAIQLTNEAFRAYVVNATGKPLRLPTGPSATPIQNQSGQMPKSGFLYSYFFPNPDNTVKPGDQVTLVIGEMREKLIVQ